MTEQSNQSPVIDAGKAVLAARIYIRSHSGTFIKDLLLEEVELTDDRKFWLITLGFTQLTGSLEDLLSTEAPEKEEIKYKIFKVNAETGKVESMKIREL
jgi:hypothetical protein